MWTFGLHPRIAGKLEGYLSDSPPHRLPCLSPSAYLSINIKSIC
jgi:hypothetical protein